MGTARLSCRRPGCWLLVAALFVALSCPARGLKSLASEGESEHKVRAMLQAAALTFEAQLGESQTSEVYVLTRAILERFVFLSPYPVCALKPELLSQPFSVLTTTEMVQGQGHLYRVFNR